jgi:hypothetical protein
MADARVALHWGNRIRVRSIGEEQEESKMKLLAITITVLLAFGFASSVQARNTPCSGKKGGISHCSGEKFVCKNGTMSASKRKCSQ